jgi:hypothetical protein
MPLFERSRFTFCVPWFDDLGRLYLDDRAPYRYRAFADNTVHLVQEGDTIWSIAGQHFRPAPRAAGLWWAIADFQPNPIHDPTIALVPGSVLVLPSLRTVLEEVLGEARRSESRL